MARYSVPWGLSLFCTSKRQKALLIFLFFFVFLSRVGESSIFFHVFVSFFFRASCSRRVALSLACEFFFFILYLIGREGVPVIFIST